MSLLRLARVHAALAAGLGGPRRGAPLGRHGVVALAAHVLLGTPLRPRGGPFGPWQRQRPQGLQRMAAVGLHRALRRLAYRFLRDATPPSRRAQRVVRARGATDATRPGAGLAPDPACRPGGATATGACFGHSRFAVLEPSKSRSGLR